MLPCLNGVLCVGEAAEHDGKRIGRTHSHGLTGLAGPGHIERPHRYVDGRSARPPLQHHLQSSAPQIEVDVVRTRGDGYFTLVAKHDESVALEPHVEATGRRKRRIVAPLRICPYQVLRRAVRHGVEADHDVRQGNPVKADLPADVGRPGAEKYRRHGLRGDLEFP